MSGFNVSALPDPHLVNVTPQTRRPQLESSEHWPDDLGFVEIAHDSMAISSLIVDLTDVVDQGRNREILLVKSFECHDVPIVEGVDTLSDVRGMAQRAEAPSDRIETKRRTEGHE